MRRSERGVVSTEFLISLFPMLTLVLGIAQIAMAFTAGVVTQHAAYVAARSAATVLPEGDDPDLVPDDRQTPPGTAHYGDYGGHRYEDVQQAAAFVTAAVSPRSVAPAPGQSVAKALVEVATGYDGNAVALWESSAKNEYALRATNVELFGADGGDSGIFDDTSREVRARVTYLFRCNIPLANRIVCKPYSEIVTGDVARAVGRNPQASLDTAGRYLAIVREATMQYQYKQVFQNPGS